MTYAFLPKREKYVKDKLCCLSKSYQVLQRSSLAQTFFTNQNYDTHLKNEPDIKKT